MSSKFSIYFRCPTESQYAFTYSSIHATSPAYFILLDIITRIIFDKGYRCPSSSFRNFLYPFVTSFISDQNMFISAPLSKSPCLLPFHNLRPRFMPTQNKGEHLEHGRQYKWSNKHHSNHTALHYKCQSFRRGKKCRFIAPCGVHKLTVCHKCRNFKRRSQVAHMFTTVLWGVNVVSI
jgi:hypothetical protein